MPGSKIGLYVSNGQAPYQPPPAPTQEQLPFQPPVQGPRPRPSKTKG